MSDAAALAAIEAVTRQSYGRLVAYLAARSGDIAGAEDALSDAFMAALQHWPVDGVPQKPEAWLLHTARNRRIDAARRQQVRAASAPFLQQIAEDAQTVAALRDVFPDERLKLLFVCAHPAVEPAARTPLMLQTVLGLDAERIASAFLTSPAAMGKRLVRAKEKIRAAKIPFHVPEPAEWEERVGFVLDALYAAYTAGWESVSLTDSPHLPLAKESIDLGQTLVELIPHEPEARGLLALMLHCEARRDARFSSAGEFIPLDQQSTESWSRPLIEEAESQLRIASTAKKLGRFQLEAAIQSIHANRITTGSTDWSQIALLYEGLVRLSPGIGSQVGRAVALAQIGQSLVALAALGEIPRDRIVDYQPYWAARGHVLKQLDRREECQAAYLRAAALTENSALRAHLLKNAESTEPPSGQN